MRAISLSFYLLLSSLGIHAAESKVWKFNFKPDDFLMVVKYYGPNPKKYYSFSAGSPSHRKTLEKRKLESKHITAICTKEEILNWRSLMHPPGRVGGKMKDGRFEPEVEYVGYVVQIQTNGKHMFSELRWDLETYDALAGFQACCWRSHPTILLPMLNAVAKKREEWARKRYKILLSPKWHRFVIGVGSGSCWGESASPIMEAVREGQSVRFRRPNKKGDLGKVLSSNSDKIMKFQKELYEYAVYFALHGSCPPNSWKVYSITKQTNSEDKMKVVFYGYGAPQDPKVVLFEKWIRHWMEVNKSDPLLKK